ncbi:ABC transporter permease, partial [Actinotignum timonense]
MAWIVVRQSLSRTKGRLALITGAVAFGTVLLLAFAAFTHATLDRTAESWEDTLHDAPYASDLPAAAASSHIKMYRPGIDDLAVIGGAQVEVVYVDAAGVSDPAQLHGITWPGRGEYLLSRGARTLLETSANPAVAHRFGRVDRGTLPQELTNGPDDLLAVVGTDLSEVEDARSLASFEPAGSSGSDPNFILLLIGLVVLLFPVLFLISISAALGSAQREQRYATLRLVGATRRQVRGILILEALVGAAAGYVLGAALF